MISFVGAGPGAPDLLTLRGAARLAEADTVVWASSLVPEFVPLPPSLLALPLPPVDEPAPAEPLPGPPAFPPLVARPPQPTARIAAQKTNRKAPMQIHPSINSAANAAPRLTRRTAQRRPERTGICQSLRPAGR